MHTPNEYLLHPRSFYDQDLVEKIFVQVWRLDFSTSGFCLLDIGPKVDSQTLRTWMVALKERLSESNVHRCGRAFRFRSMARFDQQETTKFHLDGAPEQSLLILGYEPSKVRSRLFLADFTRAALDLGISPQQFLRDYNPMYSKGEDLLGRYTTELPQPDEGHSRILLINNCALPFTEDRSNPLGVMHKAILVTPNKEERRIVNSTMLVTEGDEISSEDQARFLTTDKISERNY